MREHLRESRKRAITVQEGSGLEKKMSEILAKIRIKGHPFVLKNHKEIAYIPLPGQALKPPKERKKRAILVSSKAAKKYMKTCLEQLALVWNDEPITGPIAIKFTFYIACKQESNSVADMSNLYGLPEDALQKAGVLADDRQIQHHDGSRRVFLCSCDCPKKELYQMGAREGAAQAKLWCYKEVPL